MLVLVCAGLTSAITYSIQAAVYWHPLYELEDGPSRPLAGALFVHQKSTLLVAGYIFWILHRAINISRTGAIQWVSTWIVGMLLLFGYGVQIVAVGMVTSRANSDRYAGDNTGNALVGERIWTATLAAQAIALMLLGCNAIQLYLMRAKASIVPANKVREMRLFLLCIMGALVLLFVRTIFRAATTVFAANHSSDVTTTFGTYPGQKLSPQGEGSTYTIIAWLNFGLDGLPVLFALVVLAIMPVTRVIPTTESFSTRYVPTSSTRVRLYQFRPDVRVSATFDAASPDAARIAREARNQGTTTTTTTETRAPPVVQTVEMREQAIVAGEQPNLRELPPAYDAAPAYEEPTEPVGGARGVLEGTRQTV